MPTMYATPFQEFLDAVAQYYGSGSDQWVEIAKYGTASDDFVSIVNQLPNYSVVTNKAGDIIGYQKVGVETVSSAASAVNSNIAGTSTTLQTPATVTVSQETGKVVATKGVTGSGASGLQFITKSVIPAIAAAGVGITLGKTIDSVLYNANPDFWDSHGMGALNPATWASITADMSDSTGEQALATAFNLLYGINPTANTGQAYVDEMAFAYLAAYMANMGVFNGTEYTTTIPASVQAQLPAQIPLTFPIEDNGFYASFYTDAQLTNKILYHIYTDAHTAPVYVTVFEYLTTPTESRGFHWVMASTQPFSGYTDLNNTHTAFNSTQTTVLGETVYYAYASVTQRLYLDVLPPYGTYSYSGTITLSWRESLAYAMVYGERHKSTAIEGFGDQTGATLFNINGISDFTNIAAILAALRAQYPDLFNNAVTYPVMQGDGTTVNHNYVPIAMPDGNSATDTKPTGDGSNMSQANPAYDPTIMPDDVWDYIWDIINNDDVDVDEDTGEGDTPVIVPPVGSASALWKIYNPSQSQLDTFGAWLWSSDFVDQILKLFNDPMQAIIGLHKIFVTPSVSGSGAIKVGYLTSNASANYVSGQYVDVDCGSVSLEEYFHNVFDYENTAVSIYLPFSGIHKLNVGDVMRGTIKVIYHVDVLTGACLIDIDVTRDAAGGVLYTFSGNCAVQYPVSSGSYVGIVTGILGIAGGIAGTIATGGALAPMLMGAGASIGHMHADVQHSGNISANAGAMGCKKPYIIIERAQVKTPTDAVAIEGLPQNEIVTLSSLSGHVKVKKAHYDGIACTSGELEKIRGLLESGVFIS